MTAINRFAGDEDLGSFEPTQIFAGSADIVTDGGEVVEVEFAQYQPIIRTATGGLAPYVAGQDPDVLPFAISTLPGVVGSTCPYYVGGTFNHEAMVWDAAVNTLALRRELFARTNINISFLK